MANFNMKDTINYKKINSLREYDEILIGFPSGIPHDGGIDTSELAKMLSYGTNTIPARPFLEEGIIDGKDKIQNRVNKYYERKLSGDNSDAQLHAIAVVAVGSVQTFVRGDHYKSTIPNSESTIRAKSHNGNIGDKPLIDTAEMINSLTYIIHNIPYQEIEDKKNKK